jgi:hypothetical protein
MRKRAVEKFQTEVLDSVDGQKIAYAQDVYRRHGAIGAQVYEMSQQNIKKYYQ